MTLDDTAHQFTQKDIRFMELALQEARQAMELGEVPVGAVVVDGEGTLLAKAGNRPILDNDPTGHAEMIAMRQAGQKSSNYRLPDATLYVTIEPCVMCAGAMIHARIRRLVFGAVDPKAGALVSQYAIGTDGRLNHRMQIAGGLLADECGELLTSFFRMRRG